MSVDQYTVLGPLKILFHLQGVRFNQYDAIQILHDKAAKLTLIKY